MHVSKERERWREGPGIGALLADGSLPGRPCIRTEAKAEVNRRFPKPLARVFNGSDVAEACASDEAWNQEYGSVGTRSRSTEVED